MYMSRNLWWVSSREDGVFFFLFYSYGGTDWNILDDGIRYLGCDWDVLIY
jgi:hypothetical protein